MSRATLTINTSVNTPKGPEGSPQITARTASEDSYDLKDIITQTDKDGRPISRNARRSPRLSAQQEIDEISPDIEQSSPSSSPRYSQRLFRRFLCCFCSHRAPKTDSVVPVTQTSRIVSHRPPQRVSINGRLKLMSDLPPLPSGQRQKKCLVLDLDETLVHSSFQYVRESDFSVGVRVEDVVHNVYVLKRPGVDAFLKRMAALYEVVIYTASLNKYADPLLDILDPDKLISKRLFREDCVYHEGSYVKDLSLLNRDLSQCIIIDNSPYSYVFHPENAIDCSSFINDPEDRELFQIADYLEFLHEADDVRGKTRSWKSWCKRNPSSAASSASS